MPPPAPPRAQRAHETYVNHAHETHAQIFVRLLLKNAYFCVPIYLSLAADEQGNLEIDLETATQ